jgi:hypothetical protein
MDNALVLSTVKHVSTLSCPVVRLITETDLEASNGRAISQPVSRRFPTTAVRAQCQVRSCGICRGQSVTARSTKCSIIIYHRGLVQLATDIPSGLSLTPLHEVKKIDMSLD